jgi:hypothetical protein
MLGGMNESPPLRGADMHWGGGMNESAPLQSENIKGIG